VLKGINVPLPEPHKFYDKDGHERDPIHVRWWDTRRPTIGAPPCYLPSFGAAKNINNPKGAPPVDCHRTFFN